MFCYDVRIKVLKARLATFATVCMISGSVIRAYSPINFQIVDLLCVFNVVN